MTKEKNAKAKPKKVTKKKPLTKAQMKARKDKYEAELLNVIKTKKIMFFDHCFAFATFSRATAYNHDLDKMDSIKDAINTNKVNAKNYMLNKWVAGDNATLQIAAMRMIAEPDEHRKLNQAYLDHTTDGKPIKISFED